MNRLVLGLLALAPLAAACSSDGYVPPDLGPDLALRPQVTHVGIEAPTCCVDPSPNAARVLYLANPKPQTTSVLGVDLPTRGEAHLADAYGFDTVLAQNVPRDSYAFTPAGDYIMYFSPSPTKDQTFALNFAALPKGELGEITPITVIPRGLAYYPLSYQLFYSATGRYLITGASPVGIQNSADMTIVDVETARVVFTLPNGSFDYVETWTSRDVMVFENSVASKTPGTPSVEGLYVIPMTAAASGGTPALIDTHVATFALTPDESRIVYTKTDGTMWMYGLTDQSIVQLDSNVAKFSFLYASADGPLVTIKNDDSLHIAYLQHKELVTTAPGTIDPWTTFVLAPDATSVYYFAKTQNQDSAGDLYNIPLTKNEVATQGTLIANRVSIADLQFGYGQMRYIRNINGSGDTGELVVADLEGKNAEVIAQGVALGSTQMANPYTPQPTAPKGNPVRAPQDFQAPTIPPVYTQLVNAYRDTKPAGALIFDDSPPIVGNLGFARANGTPVIVDPAVHVGNYSFSADGYELLYAGGATYNSKMRAYLGTLSLYQTTIDTAPVVPMLEGVAQLGPIHGRELFVAAPGATPAGTYYVHY